MILSRRTAISSAALGLAAAAGAVWYSGAPAVDPNVQAADEALSHRDFERASYHLEHYLADHPDDLDARLSAARTARRRQDYVVAASQLRKYEELNGPKDRSDFEYRLIKLQQGQVVPDAAEQLVARYGGAPPSPELPFVMEAVAVGVLQVLVPDPKSSKTLTANALPLLEAARQAADRWLVMRTTREDRAAGLMWRGRIRILGGDQEHGLADLREAVDLAPEQFESRLHLAFALELSDPAGAIEHLEYVRAHSRSFPDLDFALATTYRTVGRLDDAVRVLDAMLAAEPRSDSPLVERGLAAMDQSQFDLAGRLFARAFEVAPESPEVNLALSQYMKVRGDTAKAQEYADRFHRFEAAKSAKTQQRNGRSGSHP